MLSFITDNWMELLGFTTGLAYLYYEYMASPHLWVASVIMPVISMVIYFDKGIYADFGINVYYFIISVYGWITWMTHKRQEHGEDMPITHIPLKTCALLACVFLAIYAFLVFILKEYTDSTVPYLDSFTTSLSIIAMWMLARKHVEQWLAWIAVDAVSSCLYCYKGIYFYSTLYAIYTIIAVFGYRKWLRMMAFK